MSSRKDTSAVATFGDHEVITPENKLRKAVSTRPYLPTEDDPVVRAEKALNELSHEFVNWMDQECDRLDKARHAIMKSGMTAATKEQLFHAAHDIKGEAATFGFPACAATADSLCRLIEYAPDQTKIPHKLIEQHVDAVRAIVREYSRSDAVDLARELNKRLREVTDEFLLHANRDRPDILSSITGPSLVPHG